MACILVRSPYSHPGHLEAPADHRIWVSQEWVQRQNPSQEICQPPGRIFTIDRAVILAVQFNDAKKDTRAINCPSHKNGMFFGIKWYKGQVAVVVPCLPCCLRSWWTLWHLPKLLRTLKLLRCFRCLRYFWKLQSSILEIQKNAQNISKHHI